MSAKRSLIICALCDLLWLHLAWLCCDHPILKKRKWRLREGRDLPSVTQLASSNNDNESKKVERWRTSNTDRVPKLSPCRMLGPPLQVCYLQPASNTRALLPRGLCPKTVYFLLPLNSMENLREGQPWAGWRQRESRSHSVVKARSQRAPWPCDQSFTPSSLLSSDFKALYAHTLIREDTFLHSGEAGTYN